MAITLIGTAFGPVTSASTLTNAAALPAGTSAGDIVIAVAAAERSTDIPTLPTGFTIVMSTTQLTVVATTIGWKRLEAADVSNGSITMTNASGRRQKIGIAIYRGADNPVWTAGTSPANAGGQDTLTGPAVTPGFNDSRLVSIFGMSSATAPLQGRNYSVASGGYTELVDQQSNSTSANAGVHIAERALVGQANISQAAITLTDVTGFSTAYLGGAFALSPTSATPPVLVVSASYDWSVVDATASTSGASGTLSYSISPQPGTQEFSVGKFLVPRKTVDVVYTVTVSETGNGTDSTPTIIVLKAGAGTTTSEAEIVVSNGTVWF